MSYHCFSLQPYHFNCNNEFSSVPGDQDCTLNHPHWLAFTLWEQLKYDCHASIQESRLLVIFDEIFNAQLAGFTCTIDKNGPLNF